MSLQQYERLGLVNERFLRMQLGGTSPSLSCLKLALLETGLINSASLLVWPLCFLFPGLSLRHFSTCMEWNDGKSESARTVMRYILQRRCRRKRVM